VGRRLALSTEEEVEVRGGPFLFGALAFMLPSELVATGHGRQRGRTRKE